MALAVLSGSISASARFAGRFAASGTAVTLKRLPPLNVGAASRFSGFSFAGPKDLGDILDKDACSGLRGDELAALWREYHEKKKGSIGWVVEGSVGKMVLHRAREKNGKVGIAPIESNRTTNI